MALPLPKLKDKPHSGQTPALLARTQQHLIDEGSIKPEEYESICNAMNGAMEGVDYKLLPDNGLYPVSGGLASYVDSLGKVGLVMETAQSFQPGPEKRDIEVDRASDAVVEFVRQMQARANGNA